jgi:CMP-N-acetylneuraminic acid synthetase
MKIFTYIKNDSSRVKRKNFQYIGFLPLWKHLLYELSDFDIFIDTDSQEVLKECETDSKLSNVTSYMRNKVFIDIENDSENKVSPSNLMIENFLDKYVTDYDEQIALIHVTSPFLKKDTLLNAFSKMIQGGFETANSVYSIRDFAYFGEDYKPINFNPRIIQRTQDLKKISFSCGAFFLFSKESFKKYNNRTAQKQGKNMFYEISKIEAVEIDTKEDLEVARIIYRGLYR